MCRAPTWLALLVTACSSTSEPPTETPIVHERFSHTVMGGMTGLATGSFESAALEHGRIAVDPAYRHVLSFLVTPMLPPQRTSVPSPGPLILFTDDLEVIVFSPTNHFYESLIWFEDGAIHYGVEGEIDTIPAGFSHDFIIVKGHGINRTVDAWGALVRDGRPAPDRYGDVSLSRLGYWTDNGAFYYYRTEGELNEHDTLLAVKRDADARGLPFGYFQLDSWWYEKAPGSGANPWGGVTRWTPQAAMFPEGLEAFQAQLAQPLVLHNRWFAPTNDYSARHDFVADGGPQMALPAEGAIFDELMQDAVRWGAVTYEQDWLIPQFWGIPHLRNGVGHAARWVGDIDAAAQRNGLTTQLTMAGGAHLMDAVNRPTVTSVRTSIDYAPNAPKTSFWPQFHTVNMLAGALGLWPFKDNFQASETWGAEEALISVLSAGLVGVGDQVGAAPVEIVLRTCRSDGVLLKPSRPATPIDAMFLPHARPYLVRSYSDHPTGRWTYLAAFHIERGDEERRGLDDLHAAFAYDGVPLSEMFVIPDRIERWDVAPRQDLGLHGELVAYDWETREAHRVDETFELRPTTEPFRQRYVVLAPVFDNGLALIGEPDKYVTMADRRFTEVTATDDTIELTLAGAPEETVTVLVYDANEEVMRPDARVTIDSSGKARMTIVR